MFCAYSYQTISQIKNSTVSVPKMMQGGNCFMTLNLTFYKNDTKHFLLPRKGSKVYFLLEISQKNTTASKLEVGLETF